MTERIDPKNLKPIGVVGVELYRKKANGIFVSRRQQRIHGARLDELYGALAELEICKDWLMGLIKETQKASKEKEG